jgi:hypothetical protein
VLHTAVQPMPGTDLANSLLLYESAAHMSESRSEHVPCFALQLESLTHVASCRQIASDLHGAFRQQHMLRRVIDIIVQYNAAAVYSHFCRAEVSEYTPRQLRRM